MAQDVTYYSSFHLLFHYPYITPIYCSSFHLLSTTPTEPKYIQTYCSSFHLLFHYPYVGLRTSECFGHEGLAFAPGRGLLEAGRRILVGVTKGSKDPNNLVLGPKMPYGAWVLEPPWTLWVAYRKQGPSKAPSRAVLGSCWPPLGVLGGGNTGTRRTKRSSLTMMNMQSATSFS